MTTCILSDFQHDRELGVAVVGLDSVSRLNFMRQLPKSFKVITDTLDGVVLKGFNKVGENTFPNLIPILTGEEVVKPRRLKYYFAPLLL